jgi:hypothetical protein
VVQDTSVQDTKWLAQLVFNRRIMCDDKGFLLSQQSTCGMPYPSIQHQSIHIASDVASTSEKNENVILLASSIIFIYQKG